MKTPRIAHIATLALAFGVAAFACAAQDRPSSDRDRPKPGNDHQQARPEQQHQQQQRSASLQEQPAAQQRRQSPQAQQRRPEEPQHRSPQARQQPSARVSRDQGQSRQQRGAVDSRRGERQAAWQHHRADNWQSDHRTWQQRGGYHGYRIPDDRFRGYFGPDHGFRIHGLPFMVVGGYPRFQYRGYWLSVVDPWPDNWGDNWYDSDQVYVVYSNNGYYLYNRSYPGVGIAVSISM
jgi:hypothetical protein